MFFEKLFVHIDDNMRKAFEEVMQVISKNSDEIFGGKRIMETIMTILVTFFAGMGAGLGTGFAGMSAAAVISPMLITF